MTDPLLFAWLATILVCGALEELARPRAVGWHQRPWRVAVLHLAASTGLLVFFLFVTSHREFSVVCAIGIVGLLVVVSNAKFKALREPLVFSDLALFAQSLFHPRMYFPFFSWPQVAVLLLGSAALLSVLRLDSPIDAGARSFLAVAWLLLFWLQLRLVRGIRLSLQLTQDQTALGFFSTFVLYMLRGLSGAEIQALKAQFAAAPYVNPRQDQTRQFLSGSSTPLPDVVVVQSESFFDVRRAGICLMPGVLSGYDAVKQAALYSGELKVPAWGANTMRTEHAFLTGLANDSLRFGKYYPYLFITHDVPALPRAFHEKGYLTSAVHPYASKFFSRHKVFPRLGFDALHADESFVGAAKCGAFVADEAVGDWLIQELKESSHKPRLLFAITMENHGPLHLEAADPGEAQSYYMFPDGQDIDDLTVYMRHLRNAEKMLLRLTDYLSTREHPTVVCFYGDHVPGMGTVYDALGSAPENTDFLIWCNPAATGTLGGLAPARQTSPDQLGQMLARLVGVL